MTALEAAAVIVPIVVLLIGVSLLAYGLVAWASWEDRRVRNGGKHLGRWN